MLLIHVICNGEHTGVQIRPGTVRIQTPGMMAVASNATIKQETGIMDASTNPAESHQCHVCSKYFQVVSKEEMVFPLPVFPFLVFHSCFSSTQFSILQFFRWHDFPFIDLTSFNRLKNAIFCTASFLTFLPTPLSCFFLLTSVFISKLLSKLY